MKDWYQKLIEEVVHDLHSDANSGLSSHQVQEKLRSYGYNSFEQPKKTPLYKNILHQLKDISTIILLLAAILSFLSATHGEGGYIESITILVIITINMVLAIRQEQKTQKALDALQDLSNPTCYVKRDGQTIEIETSAIVPGDIILLSTGMLVPADGRLVATTNLAIDESPLTGESEAINKDAMIVFEQKVPISEQNNMVFSGTLVTAGKATIIITATGMHTELGKIASFLNHPQKRQTPLQIRLSHITKWVSYVAIIAALILLVSGLLKGDSLLQMLLLSVSLAVAAVPETLNLIVTLSLINGVQRMVKKHALIRRLPAIETLGNVSIICSDKTGTITQNKMQVETLWLSSTNSFASSDTTDVKMLDFIEQLALSCNDDINHIGNATDRAILQLSMNHDISPLFDRVAEIPFSSSRKMMSVVIKNKTGGYTVLTKGAYDRLPLKQSSPAGLKAHDTLTKQALRVLALATKTITTLPKKIEEIEKDLTLVGLVGVMDPPRIESAKAIKRAQQAGIKTIMITGDHASTATAIAKKVGILSTEDEVLTGQQLDALSDEQLHRAVSKYTVYARVSPENKIRIVKAWQKHDAIVAMTGDGVNDAPALEAADIGIAMGKNGTEVAKNAADMILMDDNFATIVNAIQEGRYVYANIRKTIYFLLVCNLSEIVTVLFAQVTNMGVLVTPILLLLVNLLGDGIPGIHLAKETANEHVMNRPPMERKESFFSNGILRLIIHQTIACSIVIVLAFYIGAYVPVSSSYPPSQSLGQAMAFIALGWTSVLHIFNVRSTKSIFTRKIRSNPGLVFSSFAMLLAFVCMVSIPPIAHLFSIQDTSMMHISIAMLVSILPSIYAELYKVSKRNR